MSPYEYETTLTDAARQEYRGIVNERWSADSSYGHSKETRNEFLAGAGGIGLVALIIEFLWIGPFTRQLPIWRAGHAHKKIDTKNNRIIGRDSLTPYSVADELLKWAKLGDDGHITEDEYQKARMTLLNSQ